MSTVVDLSALGSLGFGLNGSAAGDAAGASVSDAGDVNGDGFDDIIVGAPLAGLGAPGAAYVVFGHAGGFGALDLGNLQPTEGFQIQGSGSDYAGISVSAAGDINGDGFDDLVVGTAVGGFYTTSSSRAYVIFGKESGFGTIDVSQLANSAGFVITGTANRADSLTVANAGDVNGDGFDDIIIGDPAVGSFFGRPGSGAFYVVFGKADGFASVDLAYLTPGAGFSVAGPTSTRTGVSVSGAGDVNGDGFDDIIVGANLGDYGGNNSGQAYVIFGRANGVANLDLSDFGLFTHLDAGFMIRGGAAEDWAGFSVSAAGDVNGDGFADVIVSAPLGDSGGDGAGQAYVIFGHSGAFNRVDLSNLGNAGFLIQGDVSGDAAGWSVSGAGDVNGDGFDDLIVGAPSNDAGGAYAGAAYVIYGRPTNFATIDLTNLSPMNGFVIQGDLADDRAGQSVSAAGDVNGDGLDDLIIGARTADRGGQDSGAAYVIFGTRAGAHDAANDFNGDGRSDVLWRNADGTVTDWLGTINGGFAGNAPNINWGAPLDWTIAGTGDFNGDHRDDILWRNSNGTVTDWLGAANGGFANNDANALTGVPADWHVAGTGDFNGDGRADLLWRHSDGTITDWLGTASGGFAANWANSAAAVPLNWHIIAIGDFNGDQRGDILWREDNGMITDWLSTPTGGFADNWTNASAAVSLDWTVAGVGDFNGDGRDDILWRNANGTVTDWLGTANDSFAANWNSFASGIPNDWTVAQIGDFDGDTRDDILWRNGSGVVTNWLGTSTGAFIDNWTHAAHAVATSWHVEGQPFA